MKVENIVYDVGSSKKKKTGDWRNFKPVVTDKCTGCGICAQFCPEGAIQIINKKAVVDYDYCKGCMICMNECPVKAIMKEQEKK